MKKFFALVLAVAMVLSMGSAFASVGWAQSSNASANAIANVSISVKALEYSGTLQDYTQYGLSSAQVWKEITGRVVKDTLVKFPVTVTVPGMDRTGLLKEDYDNAKISIALTNATAWKVVDANGYDFAPDRTTITNNGHTVTFNQGTYDLSTGYPFAFTVLAIVDSTAEVNCTVTFSMGQKVYKDGTPMYFGKYVAEWVSGQYFQVTDTSDNSSIRFGLDPNNKFTSSISFLDYYMPQAWRGNYVPVSYCLNGEVQFNGACACNKYQWPSDLLAVAWYEQVKADFNEIMNAIGFSFSYGNFAAAYCTEAGVGSLLKSTKVSASVKIGACTELGVGVTTPTVTIPQTGAVSILGYALVTLAGAALAISKKK